MALIDNNSLLSSTEALALFAVPPTLVGIQRCYDRIYPLKRAIVPNMPLYFDVPENPAFTDVASMTLHVKFKVTKQSGGDLDVNDADHVAPINYILNTMWNQIKLYVNNVLLWDSGNTYPYKAIIEAILGFNPNEKNTYLQSALYFEDTGDDINAIGEGAKKRSEFTNTSKIIQVCGSMHIDPFNQERFWPPQVPFQLELYPNKDAFSLLVDNDTQYKLLIETAHIKFRMVEVSDSLKNAFELRLRREIGAKYPIRRSEIKILHLAAGRIDLPYESIETGTLPRRVIVMFVNDKNFIGAYKTNPFKFEHCKLSSIQLNANGKDYPPRPIEPDFTSDNYIEAYYILNEVAKTDNGQPCGLTRYQFKNGYTFFAFDLSPDSSASKMHFNLMEKGPLQLKLKLKEPLAVDMKVLCYLEYDSIINIDKDRKITIDYQV